MSLSEFTVADPPWAWPGALHVGGSAGCDSVLQNEGRAGLTVAALYVMAAYVGYGLFDIVNSLAIRVLAQRVERNARDELYLSLLSKSQTFHGRQRVGDLMARVTNDVQQINQFVSPALGMTTESVLTLLIPLVTIATLDYRLLLVPLLFLAGLTLALRRHNQNLRPVAGHAARAFGTMNAGLAETITGIEVVKGFAQEAAEEDAFGTMPALTAMPLCTKAKSTPATCRCCSMALPLGWPLATPCFSFARACDLGRSGDHLYGAAGHPALADPLFADHLVGRAAKSCQRPAHFGDDPDRDGAGPEQRRAQGDAGEMSLTR